MYLDHQHGDPAEFPRNLMSQCQQYGFQRIAPTVDRMAAKTFYTTTIVADKRYTNILSNGDLAPGFYDEATSIPTPQPAAKFIEGADDSRHALTYYNHAVCMSPYLFFLSCGVYDTYRKTVEYPDGSTFMLELLLLPGQCGREDAVTAIDAVHDSIIWTYTSCGPETYDHNEERAEINALLVERQALLEKYGPTVTLNDEARPTRADMSAEDSARLAAVRARLAELQAAWKVTGYKYTGQVYREIAMANSDYGGMENVGNTTVIAARIAPSYNLNDGGYMYMEGVKVHEFYHNINGSQVTGLSPFQIWLNEAVTVHIQRKREHQLFGDDFRRLYEVLLAFMPGTGPLAQDESAVAMPIEPVGFNRTQELISAMTYQKAPEFVRMIETTLTPPVFVRGLDHYHTKYAYSNATTEDWVACMEEVSGLDLQRMLTGWLKRSGHPTVTFTTEYDADARTYSATVTQTGFEKGPAGNNGPWDFPIAYGVVVNGASTHEGVWRMTEAAQTFTVTDVATKPDFLSFAQGWSFFGKVDRSGVSNEELVKQAMHDPDVPNRYFAFGAIAMKEKVALIEAGADAAPASVSDTYLNLYATILADESLSLATRALILRIPAGTGTRSDLRHKYKEIAEAGKAMRQAVFDQHGPAVLALLTKIQSEDRDDAPQRVGVNPRFMLAMCVRVLAAGVSKKVSGARRPAEAVTAMGFTAEKLAGIVKALLSSRWMNNRQLALAYSIALAEDSERAAFIESVQSDWISNPVSLEVFVSIMSSLDTDDAHVHIRNMIKSSYFNMSLAGHARTLIRGWAGLRRRSLLTKDGLDLLVEITVAVGKVNQMSAQAALNAFDDLPRFDAETQASLVAALKKMLASLDETELPSLTGQIKTLLSSVASSE